MKAIFTLLLIALSGAMVFGQTADRGQLDQLITYGTGVVLVPIDRAAITITARGMADTASAAVNDATLLMTNINSTLMNYTLFDVRSGGLYLEPLYDGSSLSFAAHRSLAIVALANDTASIIDDMIRIGASNISFLFTPDFRSVELAQRHSLQLAVVDALFKAQSILSLINHCVSNISHIEIKNPALELPTVTFNIFANMGRNMRGLSNNINSINNDMLGSEVPSTSDNSMSQGDNSDNSNSNNNINLSPMFLGANAPLLEGDREEIVSYVELWLSHSLCTSEMGSGMIQDITSSLDLSNIAGISGGSIQMASEMASASEVASASEMLSGSEILSDSAVPMTRRSVRSSMW